MSDIYLLSNVKSNYEDIINLSVFNIHFIRPTIDFSSYDVLIFTSKNAIYSLENFNINYKNIPAYAIAPKTAEILKSYNSNLTYTGKSGHGNEFAYEIKDKIKGKKALYLRAKKVVSKLKDILNCDEVIVYETICSNQKKQNVISKNSIVIFTSPSTIKCFFKNYKWHDSCIAICIGKTTASYLPNDIKYFISNTTSIDSCIELARTI